MRSPDAPTSRCTCTPKRTTWRSGTCTASVALCEEARADPESFYRQFSDLDEAAVVALARATWQHVNLPNLREHIAPSQSVADIVVVKGPGHVITDVREHA